MSTVLWACPHCREGEFLASAADDRLGLCGGCGFALPREACASDDSTWRKQAELAAEAIERSAAAESQSRAWPNVRPDRYRIIRALAQGAQGRIFLAHHLPLDQVCVIKTLDAESGWVELGVARLRAEARAAARVAHPNVARFLDCDCVADRWYFVMEYVPGANLRQFLQAVRRLCWEQVVAIGIGIAEGLDAIHAADLVHRDIKPSNIMLRPDGSPKIMDLGLVKASLIGPDPVLTSQGQLIGTPFYMAPEQFAADGDIVPQTDCYGLGATLYHLLTGRPPHQGSGIIDLAQKHKHEPVTWPDDAVRTTPAWLRRIVETCLAKRGDHRFATMKALAEALRCGGDFTQAMPMLPSGNGVSGIVVQTFENLSRRAEHDWIGDAVAEYIESRLRAVPGLHVVDRHNLERVVPVGMPAGASQHERLVAQAAKLGAGRVIVGSFQCNGEQIRLIVRAVSDDPRTAARVSASAAGRIEDLFRLEDALADAVLAAVAGGASGDAAPARTGGTGVLAAHEQFIRGRRAFADGSYTSAIRHAEEALARDPAYAEPLSLIGAACARVGDYDRAVEFHQKAELAARRDGDSRRLAEALGNLGVMYYYKGEYPLAFDFLQQACDLCAENGQTSDRAKYAGNLGFVLMRLNRFAEAEKAFAEAIDVHKQVGDLVSLAGPYNGMGGVLLKQHRYAEAAEFYRRALGLAEEIGDRVNTGVSHMNLGRCSCLLGDFAEAEASFGEALEALETTDFWNGRTLVYEHMADMYLQEADHARALECIDERLALAEKHDNHRMQAEAWEQRAKAYELAGDREKAFESLKRSLEISQKPPLNESLHRHLSEIAKRQPFA